MNKEKEMSEFYSNEKQLSDLIEKSNILHHLRSELLPHLMLYIIWSILWLGVSMYCIYLDKTGLATIFGLIGFGSLIASLRALWKNR